MLDAVEKSGQRKQAAGAAHLRHEQAEGAGADGRIGIGADHVDIGIDAHEDDGAVAPHGLDGLRELGPRRHLLGGRDGILEVENDGVGAALMSLGDEAVRRYRHIEKRTQPHEKSPRW